MEVKKASASGRFIKLNEELGSGAFGVVFKGFDSQTGKHIAIKETYLPPTLVNSANPKTKKKQQDALLTSLQREFNLLMTLKHPNIVTVYDFSFNCKKREEKAEEKAEGEDEGFLGSVTGAQLYMEWLPSGSVQQVLDTTKFRLHEIVVRRYIHDCLKALHYLHGHGLVHRDIKPANMLLTASGSLKLSDFGTSKEIVSNASNSSGSSSVGGFIGTARYLAPECFTSSAYSKASDIWAVACSALHMLTGVVPWGDVVPPSKEDVLPVICHIVGAKEKIPGLTFLQSKKEAVKLVEKEKERKERHASFSSSCCSISPQLKKILLRCFAFHAEERPSVESLLVNSYFRTQDIQKLQQEMPSPGIESFAQYQEAVHAQIIDQSSLCAIQASLERGMQQTHSDTLAPLDEFMSPQGGPVELQTVTVQQSPVRTSSLVHYPLPPEDTEVWKANVFRSFDGYNEECQLLLPGDAFCLSDLMCQQADVYWCSVLASLLSLDASQCLSLYDFKEYSTSPSLVHELSWYQYPLSTPVDVQQQWTLGMLGILGSNPYFEKILPLDPPSTTSTTSSITLTAKILGEVCGYACRSGDFPFMKNILQQPWWASVVPLIVSMEALIPHCLLAASEGGHLALMQYLSAFDPQFDWEAVHGKMGTVATAAAANGHVHILEWLYSQKGVNVLAPDWHEDKIHYVAARNDQLSVLQWMRGKTKEEVEKEEGGGMALNKELAKPSSIGNTILDIAEINRRVNVVHWIKAANIFPAAASATK